jgi:hypothetical protein
VSRSAEEPRRSLGSRSPQNAVWASKSGGRVQVHVVRDADRGSGCNWVYVYWVHSATPEPRTGLKILAAEATAAADDARRRAADRVEIQGLADLDILEVHS